MSEQPAPLPAGASRAGLRSQLRKLGISRGPGILGLAEIVALGCSLLILILVIVSYFYFLVPARSQLASLQLERSRLQNQLRSSQDVVRQGQSTETTVQKITQSLDDFENNQLSSVDKGRMGLYAELNDLIRKNGLRNTSGPTYVTLEAAGKSTSATATKSTSTKWQSIYPGIAISVTVEGQYQNLRRFVRDLEANKQFLIINGVELERAAATNIPAQAESSSSAARPSLVSLRLEMTTYFRRPSGDEAQVVDATSH